MAHIPLAPLKLPGLHSRSIAQVGCRYAHQGEQATHPIPDSACPACLETVASLSVWRGPSRNAALHQATSVEQTALQGRIDRLQPPSPATPDSDMAGPLRQAACVACPADPQPRNTTP